MKDPAVLFYTSDFLTGTFLMTNEQVGKYIRLICFQHQHGRIAPDDFDRMTEGDQKIENKFTRDENGYFYNERLEEEIIKRSKFVESRRNNLKGGKKSTKKHHMNDHMDKHMDIRMEDEDEDVNVIEDVKENKEVRKKFNPPELNEVIQYFTENGYKKESAEKAFKYYESNNWKDSKGTKVKNWKQKMIGVWFKEENESKQIKNPFA